MKKALIFSTFIIILSVASIIFIQFSNDHIECSIVNETTVSEDGLTKITTAKHSCNENFNL